MSQVVVTSGPHASAATHGYRLNKPFLETPNWTLYKTYYWVQKEIAFFTFLDNPINGIGSGNFQMHSYELKARGHYPEEMPVYDPMSSYAGVLAETGVVGITGLFVLFSAIAKSLKRVNSNRQNSVYIFRIGCSVILLYAAFEAWSTDIMNFRHYWLVLAFWAVVERSVKSDSKSTDGFITAKG